MSNLFSTVALIKNIVNKQTNIVNSWQNLHDNKNIVNKQTNIANSSQNLHDVLEELNSGLSRTNPDSVSVENYKEFTYFELNFPQHAATVFQNFHVVHGQLRVKAAVSTNRRSDGVG